MIKEILRIFKKPKPPKTGRKTKPTEQKTTNKAVALYPGEWERIDKLANERKTSRSEIIRAALDALEASQSNNDKTEAKGQ